MVRLNCDVLKLLRFLTMSYDVEVSGQIECNARNEADIVGIYLNGTSHQVSEPLGILTFHTHPDALRVASKRVNSAPTNRDILGSLSKVYTGVQENTFEIVCAPEGLYAYRIMDDFLEAIEEGLSDSELRHVVQDWYYDIADSDVLRAGGKDHKDVRGLLTSDDPEKRKYAADMVRRAKSYDTKTFISDMAKCGVEMIFSRWDVEGIVLPDVDARSNTILRWDPRLDIEADRLTKG